MKMSLMDPYHEMNIVWNLQANRIYSFREIFVQADKNVFCSEYFVVTCERTGRFPRFKNCGVLRSFNMVVESRLKPKQHVKGPHDSKAINHSSPRLSIRPLKMPFYCVSLLELTLNYVFIWYHLNRQFLAARLFPLNFMSNYDHYLHRWRSAFKVTDSELSYLF